MNSKEDYFRAYKFFEEKYDKLGMNNFDYFFIYSDLRGFAFKLGKNLTKNEFCSAVIQPLLDKNKTVVIPTYTYTLDGIFNVTKTPTRLGALNSWVLKQPNVCRSEHPLFSFGALGNDAGLVKNCGKSAFGENSVFERLRGKKCCFLYIDKSLTLGNTLMQNVEQACGATYRYNKSFKTKVFNNNDYIGTDYTAFLRRRDVDGNDFFIETKKGYSDPLYKAGIVKEVNDSEKLSNISLLDYDKVRETMVELFYNNQSVFITKDFVQY